MTHQLGGDSVGVEPAEERAEVAADRCAVNMTSRLWTAALHTASKADMHRKPHFYTAMHIDTIGE